MQSLSFQIETTKHERKAFSSFKPKYYVFLHSPSDQITCYCNFVGSNQPKFKYHGVQSLGLHFQSNSMNLSFVTYCSLFLGKNSYNSLKNIKIYPQCIVFCDFCMLTVVPPWRKKFAYCNRSKISDQLQRLISPKLKGIKTC